MTKLEFIARQLAKAQNKRYEHYVVNRVWSLLNDSRVKFVTQQFVSRPEGRAMTDMFFPQLAVHIEVDEGFHKSQIDADKLREADIINATGHQILRVDVTKDIEHINGDIDEIVTTIKDKISSTENFEPWDVEAEMNPLTYIHKGYIDVNDNVAFRTMVEAANCFGLNIKPRGIWTGGAKHGVETNTLIWCPKLYQNKDWNNQMSDDGQVITEMSEDPARVSIEIDRVKRAQEFTRTVFPRFKGPLGDYLYRFTGKYEMDIDATNETTGFVWRRVATRVPTYEYTERPNPEREIHPMKRETRTIYTSRVRDLLQLPELDSLKSEMPMLSLKPTKNEYRFFRNGLGPGSIWIAKQRGGYRIVTTGITNSLRSDIERLTGKTASTMRDRDHLWWKGLSIDNVRGVLTAFQNL